jgi:carotenoid cleavage dioxygenase-like enzyme
MVTPPAHALGFEDLEHEGEIARLPLAGALPGWLRGTLVRNGPGRWRLGAVSLGHWFDGFAMLHRFHLADGQVGYANRLLDSRFLRHARRHGRLGQRTFTSDPRRTWWSKLYAYLLPTPGDNALVNLVPHGAELLALTESTAQLRVDPRTLETLGSMIYRDRLRGHVTTAHPHVDGVRREMINLLTRYGRVSRHQFYRLPFGSDRREPIGVLESGEPSYQHSFAVTASTVALIEYPLVVRPLSLSFGNDSILGSYRWKPVLGTRIRVLDRASGRLRATFRAAPRFGFHQVNAFEDGGQLVLDVAVNDTPEILDTLSLARLRAGGRRTFPVLHRYRLDLTTATLEEGALGDETIDFPAIDPRTAGRPTAVVYGVGIADAQRSSFLDQLVRCDITAGTRAVWRQEGCYPGEPVVVPEPGSPLADAGVVLSVVLDARSRRSFLLVLDARSFAELARAELPHHIPFGFHGQFIAQPDPSA